MRIRAFVGERGFPINVLLNKDITGLTLQGTITDVDGATLSTIGDGTFTKNDLATGDVTFSAPDVFDAPGIYLLQIQGTSGGTTTLKSDVGYIDVEKAIA
jgi:hypothetical protein